MHIRQRSALHVLGPATLAVVVSISGTAAQQLFGAPEDASKALVAAAAQPEPGALERLFGPGARDLLSSGDAEVDQQRLAAFRRAAAEAVNLQAADESTRVLVVGRDAWPFPVPIVKRAGGWAFDVNAGREELIDRTIGFNELSAIEVCHAYVDAQKEYFRMKEAQAGAPEYAQRIVSKPGQRDGLYWEAADQRDRSPLDDRLVQATVAVKSGREPYRGYFYRILKAQGASAPGGAHEYVVNGRMLAGFGLVAYPAQWGRTGVMTFICNQQGTVYQQDLGPETTQRASAMTTYDPGKGWSPVE